MDPRKFKHSIKRFAAQLATLSRRQRAGMADLLTCTLRQEDTLALIEAARAPHRACPRCHSARLHRHGHCAGLQRYRKRWR